MRAVSGKARKVPSLLFFRGRINVRRRGQASGLATVDLVAWMALVP